MNNKYQFWINNSPSNVKDIISQYNEQEIEKYFSTELEFGTAGIRGVIGYGSSLFNEYTVKFAAYGFAKYLLQKNKNKKDLSVVIGTDNRRSHKLFLNIAASVLTSLGIKVYYDYIIPTPFISFTTRELKADGAIIITASHNPKEYNGFKVYDKHGCQILPDDIAIIKEHSESLLPNIFNDEFTLDKNLMNKIDKELVNKYIETISKLNISKSTKKVKIVYSPLHGTSYYMLPKAFEDADHNLILVQNQMTPDENFSNTKSPNPEVKDAYDEAIKVANKNEANYIILTDPDSDRLGMAVRIKNDFKILTGNEMAILMLNYMIEKNMHTSNSWISYSTVSTLLAGKIAQANGIQYFETLTGFKWIGTLIEEKGSKDFMFGFEESYGALVLGDVARDKDALQSSLLIASLISEYDESNIGIFEKLESIQKKYGYINDVVKSINFKTINPLETMNQYMKKIRNWIKDKNIEYKDYVNNENKSMQTNMIKINWSNGSWLGIRPSGTEPKVKFYLSSYGENVEELKTIQSEMKTLFDEMEKL